jgi:hypothetical protein
MFQDFPVCVERGGREQGGNLEHEHQERLTWHSELGSMEVCMSRRDDKKTGSSLPIARYSGANTGARLLCEGVVSTVGGEDGHEKHDRLRCHPDVGSVEVYISRCDDKKAGSSLPITW